MVVSKHSNKSTLTLDIMADTLIESSEEEVKIPMRFLLQFNKYFKLEDDGIISAKTVKADSSDDIEIPVLALPHDFSWSLNISKENVSDSDLKEVILALFNEYMDNNLTNEEFDKEVEKWKTEIKEL